MSKKFEYATLELNDSGQEVKLMNEMGEKGWELVCILRTKATGMVIEPPTAIAYFKKDK